MLFDDEDLKLRFLVKAASAFKESVASGGFRGDESLFSCGEVLGELKLDNLNGLVVGFGGFWGICVVCGCIVEVCGGGAKSN